jgi:hypothetical protein
MEIKNRRTFHKKATKMNALLANGINQLLLLATGVCKKKMLPNRLLIVKALP